jgi:predicted TIM-barrel fold metal-dependent hydrolase
MNRLNVIGVTSGPLVDQWRAAGGERIIPGLMFEFDPRHPSVDSLRAWFARGRYALLGEVTIQYEGVEPGDPAFEPYLALAEELDIPVGIHIGPGPPGAPYLGSPKYRARMHSPLLLEEALVRHPRLRLYVMHAGWPMIDDLLALLWAYPQVYAGVGVISFAIPPAEFHRYLQRIVEAGFGKRIMFGSDQMVWPDALEFAIRNIEGATYLSTEQKRDIFYNNAARFFRFTPEQIARHRAPSR